MAFHSDVIFPVDISVGSSCSLSFNTQILAARNGSESRMSRSGHPLRTWNVKYGIRSKTDITTITDFYMAREGSVHGFRFRGPLDYSTATDGQSTPSYVDVLLGMWDGSSHYQLYKEYTSGDIAVRVPIRKPLSSSIAVGANGVNRTADWTVDDATGELTLTAGANFATGDLITFGGYYYCPVHFGEEIDLEMLMSLEPGNNYLLPDIPVIEEGHGSVAPYAELEDLELTEDQLI